MYNPMTKDEVVELVKKMVGTEILICKYGKRDLYCCCKHWFS